MKKHPLNKRSGLDGMEHELKQLLEDAATHINSNCDVDKIYRGECMERMQELKRKRGDRLKH